MPAAPTAAAILTAVMRNDAELPSVGQKGPVNMLRLIESALRVRVGTWLAVGITSVVRPPIASVEPGWLGIELNIRMRMSLSQSDTVSTATCHVTDRRRYAKLRGSSAERNCSYSSLTGLAVVAWSMKNRRIPRGISEFSV